VAPQALLSCAQKAQVKQRYLAIDPSYDLSLHDPT
jgi:hypothetical protein